MSSKTDGLSDEQPIVPNSDALPSQSVAVVIDETRPTNSNDKEIASSDGFILNQNTEMAVKGKHIIKFYDDNKVISRKKSKVLNDVNISIPKGRM